MTTYHVATGGDNLNLRSQPDIHAQIIGELPNGMNVELAQPNAVNGWFKVTVGTNGNAKTGWVASEYLLPGEAPVVKANLQQRGVNINLDADSTSPQNVGGLGFVRFVYNLSQGTGSQDFNALNANHHYDTKIQNYLNHQVTPIIILNHQFFGEGAGFDWDEMKIDNPDTRQKWARLADHLSDLAVKLVNTYGDRVVYEIWNEEDSGSKAAVQVYPAAFADLLDKCLSKIHAVAPNARVIIGGLVSGAPAYLKQTLAAMQGGAKLAGVGLHPYGLGATGQPAPYQQFGKTKDLLNAYAAVTNHSFWLTEWGVEGDPNFSQPPNVSESSVAAYIKAFLADVEQDDRVKASIYFAYADGMHNTYGLFQSNGTQAKPLAWGAMTNV